MASHRGCYLHQATFERQRLVPFTDVLGEIADQAGAIDFAEQRWGLAQSNSTRAKSLDDQAIARELIGAGDKPLDIALIEFDNFRNEKDLSGHAILGDRLFQAFIDDTLVGGVLVDNDKSITGLRHDIGVVDLRTRGAEWMIETLTADGFLPR